MHYRPLGQTGIQVSELCLGTMQFRWTATEPDSYRVLDAFFGAGCNFVDTADIYSFWVKGFKGGESETVIGKWLKRRKNRRQVILATKTSGKMWEGPTGAKLTRAHIMQACDDSLKRLQTDYIDLYLSHHADKDTPIEETLRAYRDLIAAGKVRYIGASNYTSGQLAEALAASSCLGLPQYVSYQPYYHPLARDIEKDHVWLIKKYNVAVTPYSPLAGGFFSGKYRKNRPLPKSQRAGGLKWLMNDKGWTMLDKLEEFGRRRGKTVLQMTLAWHLSHDWMTAPVVGANTIAQIKESIGAIGQRLSPDEMAELEKLTS